MNVYEYIEIIEELVKCEKEKDANFKLEFEIEMSAEEKQK